jgi:tetratricopeptide (TPR) repeat protein
VAEAHYEEALESATVAARSATASERREIAAITGSLGVAKQFSGDREGAALQFRRQLEVVSDLGDPVTAISPLSNLGNVLRILGRHDEAKAALEEGLRLAVDEHYDTILPALNINLGVLHRQLGESTVPGATSKPLRSWRESAVDCLWRYWRRSRSDASNWRAGPWPLRGRTAELTDPGSGRPLASGDDARLTDMGRRAADAHRGGLHWRGPRARAGGVARQRHQSAVVDRG